MRGSSACYDELRDYIEGIPLIDCHDHTSACGPKYEDPIHALIDNYLVSDLQSASSDRDVAFMQDRSVPWEERWPTFETAWHRTQYTGYAEVIRRVMAHFYQEHEVSFAAARRMHERLLDLTDEALHERIMDEAGIVARLENVVVDPRSITDGTYQTSPRGRLVIPLPQYHSIKSWQEVHNLVSPLGVTITSLDDYLEACRALFGAYIDLGAVAFKDQSAYTRTLAYANPTRADAEAVFNWFMEDPRRCAGYPEQTRPLDDYLMHAFMRMARDLDLPVQIHTGHMAHLRNEITKTNAVHLVPLIELHRDVRFDLFHANWPYDGELIYLGKNFPNVAIDFCWANIIDPIYCQRMFQQVISAVPHAKVHAYGSDFSGFADHAWAHASIARDNVAIALAEMVDADWFGLDTAKQIAWAWFFGNANAFFELGIQV
jgi:hypothetical protein